ncbi:hypothetical protein FBU30_004046, partial [Linnemannia zychae]
MHKVALLLLGLASINFASANYAYAMISNVGGTKDHVFQIPDTQRKCYCVKNTQTYKIYTGASSNARVFSSSDCTGNYDTVTSYISGAQWVNSISIGKAGISSSGPSGCPNYYANSRNKPLVGELLTVTILHYSSVHSTIQMSVSENIPNVGQSMLLGELYNAKTGQSINASALSNTLPSDLIDSRDEHSFNTNYFYGENYKEKFKAFDIHGSLKLNILANIVTLNGQAKYLTTEKQSSKSVKVSMSYVIQTKLEKINIRSDMIREYINLRALDDPEATHVVTGIQWGANMVCSFEHSLEEGENESEIMGILDASRNSLETSLHADGSLSYANKQTSKDISIRISILSDIVPRVDSYPNSIEEAIHLMRRVPEFVQNVNQGKGSVLQYKLEPIEKIREHFQLMTRIASVNNTIRNDLIDKIEEAFDTIVENRIRLTEASNDILEFSQYITMKEVQRIKNNLKSFNRDEKEFKNSLSEIVQAIQTEDATSLNLYQLLDELEEGSCSSVMVDGLIEDYFPLTRRISFIRRCQKINIQVIPRGTQISSVLSTSVANKTFILAILELTDYSIIEQSNVWHIFRLLIEDYNDGQTTFMIHDASISSKDPQTSHLTEPAILKFHGSNRSNQNVYRPSILRPTINISLTKPVSNEERTKLAGHVLKMPCPSSHDGECHSSGLKWVCSKCEEVMLYEYNDVVYCSCGKTWLRACTFRCDAIEHGYQYVDLHSQSIQSIQGKMRPGDDEINILLLGETGVGKSTFINAFANYLCYDTLDIAEQLEMVTLIPSSFEIGGTKVFAGEPDKNERLGSGQSSTQCCRSYVFPLDDDIKIRLIDTPGIGDTRGVKQDRINFEDILNYISGFDKINGICVLLKPNTARLTTAFRFCIDELLLHLHKSTADNILFTFTNTRSTFYGPGDTMTPLQTYMDELERTNSVSIKLEPNKMFFFDNESFRLYAALKQGMNFDLKTKEAFGASWSKSVEEARRLVKRIIELQPHKTHETVTLDRARRSIQLLVPALAQINENITIEVNEIEILKDEAKKNEFSAAELRMRLECSYMDLAPVDLEKPRTVCTSESCTILHGKTVRYKEPCHDDCRVRNIAINAVNHPSLRYCRAVKKTGFCTKCGCPWQKHMHVKIDYTEVKKVVIDTVVKKELQDKESKASAAKSDIAMADERLKNLELERRTIFESLKIFSVFLLQNSILVQNSAIMDYIDMTIKNQTRIAQKSGDFRIVESLKAQRDELVAQKDIFEVTLNNGESHSTAITVLEVNDAKEKLCRLEINGKALSSVLYWGHENQTHASNRETRILNGYTSKEW